MNDLAPFKHGQEGTHSICDERLQSKGGKATCCFCDPHEGCELTKQPLSRLVGTGEDHYDVEESYDEGKTWKKVGELRDKL